MEDFIFASKNNIAPLIQRHTTDDPPKRLSKAVQWLKDNPEGWFEIKDVRAVMR